MSREYASANRSGIPAAVWRSMTRAPARIQRAINQARTARGLELLPFDTGAEQLAEARSRGAAALARLRAVMPRGR